jgi:hypothetical protein
VFAGGGWRALGAGRAAGCSQNRFTAGAVKCSDSQFPSDPGPPLSRPARVRLPPWPCPGSLSFVDALYHSADSRWLPAGGTGHGRPSRCAADTAPTWSRWRLSRRLWRSQEASSSGWASGMLSRALPAQLRALAGDVWPPRPLLNPASPPAESLLSWDGLTCAATPE